MKPKKNWQNILCKTCLNKIQNTDGLHPDDTGFCVAIGDCRNPYKRCRGKEHCYNNKPILLALSKPDPEENDPGVLK